MILCAHTWWLHDKKKKHVLATKVKNGKHTTIFLISIIFSPLRSEILSLMWVSLRLELPCAPFMPMSLGRSWNGTEFDLEFGWYDCYDTWNLGMLLYMLYAVCPKSWRNQQLFVTVFTSCVSLSPARCWKRVNELWRQHEKLTMLHWFTCVWMKNRTGYAKRVAKIYHPNKERGIQSPTDVDQGWPHLTSAGGISSWFRMAAMNQYARVSSECWCWTLRPWAPWYDWEVDGKSFVGKVYFVPKMGSKQL